MILDKDPLVNRIVAFFKWIKKVPMTIPKQHEQLLERMRDYPKSGTVGERILCGEVIREAKLRFVKGMANGEQSTAKERQDRPANPHALTVPRDYFSIEELAERWRCSRGTVYNRLRVVGAQVLDFGPRGKRGRKAVSLKTVLQIENQQTKRLR
jgi:hypothetical protein